MNQPTLFEIMQRFRNWLILLTIAGACAGAAYGLLVSPEYRAESTLSVGRVDVETQAIPGFTTASMTLADAYSRAINADGVVSEISRESGLSKASVMDRVSSAPVPQTGTVRVFADSPGSADNAVSLANTAAEALVDYVRKLNRFNPESARLLRRYHEAVETLAMARRKLDRKGNTPANLADVQTAQLELNSTGSLYQSSQAGQSAPNTLQVLALAGGAETNRASKVQQGIVFGAFVGFVAGVGLALVMERRYPLGS